MTFERKGIDFLRGIGCLVIMLYHFIPSSGSPLVSSILLEIGHAAMCMFFTASAFILTNSMLKMKENNTYTFKVYMQKRFFRIIPVWWFFLFFYCFYYQPEIEHIMANIFFYFGFLQHIEGYNFVQLSWSLFVEECIYLILPITLIYVKTSLRSIVLFAFGIIVYMLWGRYVPLIFPGDPQNIWMRHPIQHFVDFTFGLLIYFNFNKLQFNNKSMLLHQVTYILLFITSLVSVYYQIYFMAGGLIVLCMTSKNFISKLFVSKPFTIFQYMGVRCLSLYLVHDLVIIVIHKTLKYLGREDLKASPSIWLIFVFIGLCILVSHFTYKHVELKSIGLRKHFKQG